MAIANIFQKLRASAPATAVTALAGFLTLATPFSNATAQEPFKTSHTPGAPNITEQHKPTILRQASDYAETTKAIGIIVAKGKKDEAGLTGAKIGEMIQGYFSSLGITSEVFTAPSSADYTTVGYTVKTRLFGPVGLDKAKGMAVVASSHYDDAYGTHINDNPLAASIPSNSQQ